MKTIKARQVIFILDACRNDPEKGGKGDGDNKLTPDFAKRISLLTTDTEVRAAGSGTLFACSEGQRAYEWYEQQQGAFTYFLLEGLSGKAAGLDGRLTLQGVAQYVQQKMPDWCKKNSHEQLPELRSEGAAELVLGYVTFPTPKPEPVVKPVLKPVVEKKTDPDPKVAMKAKGLQCFNEGHYTESARLLRSSAEAGDARDEALLGISRQGHDGRVTAEVRSWFRKSAEAGDALGKFALAGSLNAVSDREEIARLYRDALPDLQREAEANDSIAQTYLALCYENGYGVERNPTKAALWFSRAAHQESAVAQHHLGNCYEQGKGVKKDAAQAVVWYTRAAEQGYEPALMDLGGCYEIGTGVKPNTAKAAEYFTRAAKQGNEYAKVRLASLKK